MLRFKTNLKRFLGLFTQSLHGPWELQKDMCSWHVWHCACTPFESCSRHQVKRFQVWLPEVRRRRKPYPKHLWRLFLASLRSQMGRGVTERGGNGSENFSALSWPFQIRNPLTTHTPLIKGCQGLALKTLWKRLKISENLWALRPLPLCPLPLYLGYFQKSSKNTLFNKQKITLQGHIFICEVVLSLLRWFLNSSLKRFFG